jgi:cobalt-zinc-cadmium efflux system protein
MPHDHDQMIAPEKGDRRVSLAIWANLLLTFAQIAGGLISGSLALIADALHNFSDMAALLIAFAARKIARRPANRDMTFGYGRIEVVAALVNYTTLIIIGAYMVFAGAMRLFEPPEVGGWTVVILGSIALIVDTLTAMLTYSMQKGSMNIRALFLHNLSDALSSVAVVAGGILILLYDWRLVDPLVTIGIAVYILYLSLTEIGRPIRTLMLGSPPDIDTDAVLQRMRAVSGVGAVHHAHFWQMQENEAALDSHVVVDPGAWARVEEIKQAIKDALRADFGICHSTLEFERAGNAHQQAAVYGHDAGQA